MSTNTNQSLGYLTKDIIAHLNEMVAAGYIVDYLETLEKIEDLIFSDDGGTFADVEGESRPGIFMILKTIRALKTDLRTLNALCPSGNLPSNTQHSSPNT